MNIFFVVLLSCIICYIYASEESGMDLGNQEISLAPVELEDHIASSPEEIAFIEKVYDGDMEAAREAFEGGNDGLRKYCTKHLISLGSSKLVELINGANGSNIKSWL